MCFFTFKSINCCCYLNSELLVCADQDALSIAREGLPWSSSDIHTVLAFPHESVYICEGGMDVARVISTGHGIGKILWGAVQKITLVWLKASCWSQAKELPMPHSKAEHSGRCKWVQCIWTFWVTLFDLPPSIFQLNVFGEATSSLYNPVSSFVKLELCTLFLKFGF